MRKRKLDEAEDGVMSKELHQKFVLTLLPLFIGLYEPIESFTAYQHPVCRPGQEFWSTERSTCWPCTKCAPEFTLSPCAVHKDAVCGPLSALELDWSFLWARRKSEDSSETVTSKVLWRFPEFDRQEFLDKISDSEELQVSQERKKSSTQKSIPWDWQTSSLVLAVCACIVFFFVAGCSALVYARQWRHMKRSFEPASLEEISARLNLMVKAELSEFVGGAPITPGDPEIRYQYFEKLLDQKRGSTVRISWPEVSENVYIEERKTAKSERSQITRIHQNIETILSRKKNTAE
ncbi:hypothetical protein KM043_017633 [Ampulex compressa]|nr:hypothetical protein KM043_017633 [Ampulex compressa]